MARQIRSFFFKGTLDLSFWVKFESRNSSNCMQVWSIQFMERSLGSSFCHTVSCVGACLLTSKLASYAWLSVYLFSCWVNMVQLWPRPQISLTQWKLVVTPTPTLARLGFGPILFCLMVKVKRWQELCPQQISGMLGGSLAFAKLALLLNLWANLDLQPMPVRLKKKYSQILPRV